MTVVLASNQPSREVRVLLGVRLAISLPPQCQQLRDRAAGRVVSEAHVESRLSLRPSGLIVDRQRTTSRRDCDLAPRAGRVQAAEGARRVEAQAESLL